MAADDRDLFDILADVADRKPLAGAREARRREKGLPDADSRRDLARTYLKVQHRLWPDLARAGRLPRRTEAVVAGLAEAFKDRFLDLAPAPFDPGPAPAGVAAFGAGYLRYSDANSNPRSLSQQLVNVLERARRDDCFIPWEWVFADAAVTGTVAARHGYRQAKALLGRDKSPVGTLYIDEVGRASRDSIEALGLGRLIELAGKRMVGATDGFDSATPTSKMMLHVYAMVHEFFVDQLREKVKRGMRDAFERGRNIHPPAVGYKLVPVEDGAGNPVLDEDGRVVTERVIDDAMAPTLLEGARLYAEHGWSRERVARLFNEKTVGGVQTWDSARVAQLLRRHTYRGYEFNEMTYQVKDPATGGVTVKTRPAAEWKRREVPDLRIFPDDLCLRIDERLARSRAAYEAAKKADAPSRTDVYPTTLVRPVCGVCGRPLWLGRSGKYASFFCGSGKEGKGG